MHLLLIMSFILDSSLPAYWIVHTGQTSWLRMSSSTAWGRKEEESRKKMIGSNHNSHLLHFLKFLLFSNLCIILIGVVLFSGEDKMVENYLKRKSVRQPNPAPWILKLFFLACFYVLSILCFYCYLGLWKRTNFYLISFWNWVCVIYFS